MISKISTIVFVFTLVTVPCMYNDINAQQDFRDRNFLQTERNPSIADPDLKVELVAGGIELPTTMAFVGPNDFIVLEKEKGTVLRVTNGIVSNKPLLDVNVANSVEKEAGLQA